MNLRFTDEENSIRAEVRGFIRTHLPPSIHRKMAQGRVLAKEEVVAWQRILNRQGWATPSWPREYGGTGWNAVQRYIFLDELHQAPAPEPLSFNVNMIGPVLIAFGTDAQKRRFLPRIANLDDWWCQGFSEPGAGSDLAALKTSARLVSGAGGEHYIVNGQKTWQGMAQHADWMFTLVRTDPTAKKQAGITLLLIDMKAPGVSVRPIVTIDGRHEVNEVFLDDVRVPVDCRVGEENKGWDYAKFLLGHERTGIARLGMTKHLLRRAKAMAAQMRADARGERGDEQKTLADDAGFRARAAAIEIELQALEMTQLRLLAALQANAHAPDPRISILKVKGTELRQAASELLLDVAGPLAAPSAGEFDDPQGDAAPAWTDWSATIAPVYFNLRAASIYGGANEVQKNMLAKALGL
ncbi:MAG TPA: acyl-CoA dehydrogenase family protein [Burkholderiaceae bacterium]|nr:acyl-CoA dehydrogenase family protein [Burkholderiaceae bacterium]